MEHTLFKKRIDQIPGLLIIDMQGRITYMSRQCSDYFNQDIESSVGKPIDCIFPETLMLDNLYIDKPKLVFYNSHLGIGVSVHVPLFEEGERVGLAEYDVVQSSELLYELSDDYKHFLDRELNNLVGSLKTYGQTKYTINDIIGDSRPIQDLRRQIINTAKSNSTVIINGETGTGKELIAHSIHNLSSRRDEKLIKVSAASITEHMAESVLFGTENGGFSGAVTGVQKGIFELADGGTLFIDEVDQTPMHVQTKLLRVLQDKELYRVGGNELVEVNVRLITATKRNLAELVKMNKFREDLYYRLNVVNIDAPPLRKHPEDIGMLAEHFIGVLNEENGLNVKGITSEAVDFLKSSKWNGNVRELRNVLERAMNMTDSDILNVSDFNFGDIVMNFELDQLTASDNILEQAKSNAERDVILTVMKKFDNNKTKVADYLGIARPLLYQKMKRLGIK